MSVTSLRTCRLAEMAGAIRRTLIISPLMRSPRAGATSSLLGGPGQAASIPEGQTEVHRRRSSRLAYDAFGESALKAARCMAWKPTRHCARVPCARHDRRHVDMARLCGHDQPDHWTIDRKSTRLNSSHITI